MSAPSDILRIGVVGCGHWGPNYIRTFSQMPGCTVVACADPSEARRSAVGARFPQVRRFEGHAALLREGGVDAVVVATPTLTHREVVAEALRADKHVLCEKPLCTSAAEGAELVELARTRGRILMVGHIFLFNPGIEKVKELADAGEAGEIRYLSAVRTNLGPVRSDVNAAFDLASHDIAVFNWILGSEPCEARAMGAAFLQERVEDVVVLALRYPGNILASVHCSWLDPKKVRQMTLVGSKRMITWDDLALANPVAVYEKAVETHKVTTDYGEFLRLSLLEGDVRLPKIRVEEPLQAEAAAFCRSVREGRPPRSDGAFAVGVVRALELVAASLRDGGAAPDPSR